MYKNYIFDLYGTLVDIQINEQKEEVWDKLKLFYGYNDAIYKSAELKDKYFKVYNKLIKTNEKSKYPDIEIEDIFYKLYKIKQVKPKKKVAKYTAKTFRMLSTENIKLMDSVINILQFLKENKKNIFLLSNSQDIFTTSELKLLGIKEYFDGIYCSSECGIRFPDSLLYKKFLENFTLQAKESVMISTDFENVIKPLSKTGFNCIYLTDDVKKNKQKEQKYQVSSRKADEVMKLLKNKDR